LRDLHGLATGDLLRRWCCRSKMDDLDIVMCSLHGYERKTKGERTDQRTEQYRSVNVHIIIHGSERPLRRQCSLSSNPHCPGFFAMACSNIQEKLKVGVRLRLCRTSNDLCLSFHCAAFRQKTLQSP
jgi:hypothetical protein